MDSDAGQRARPNTGRAQSCQRELTIKLGIHSGHIAGRVQSREAVGRIPSATQPASPFAAERTIGWSVVAIDDARVGATVEAIENLVEPTRLNVGYANTPSPSPSIRVRTRRYSPARIRSTGRS